MTRVATAVLAAQVSFFCACARPPTAPPPPGNDAPFEALEGRPDPARWLGADPDRARAAGAGDFVLIAVDAGAPGDRVGGMVSIPSASCVLLVARGAPSVEDVDLFAYGDDGAVLGADEATDPKATLLVCPPHPSRAYVVARIASGFGMVAVGAQLVATKDADRVGGAVRARGRPNEATGALASWPGLEDALNEHRRAIGGRWRDVRRVAVPADSRTPTRLSTVVEAERCVDLLALPDTDVSALDLTVLDASGRVVGRAAARGRDRALIVCSPTKVPITLELRPHAGRGLVAVLISQAGLRDRGGLGTDVLTFDALPMGTLEDARRANARRLERAGYPPPKALEDGVLRVGSRTSTRFDLPRGCSRLDVLTGRPVRGVVAWLWGNDGKLIAKRRGAERATLFACRAKGPVRLDVEPLNGTGRYAVELRRERDAPTVLLEHPLASSRLLGRMMDRGVLRAARQVGAPTTVTLESTRFHGVDLLVPIGRCVDVTLALDTGTTGAEIRIVDTATDEEIELARGTYSAAARACALQRARTLDARAELRVAAGRGPAVYATRMLSPRE